MYEEPNLSHRNINCVKWLVCKSTSFHINLCAFLFWPRTHTSYVHPWLTVDHEKVMSSLQIHSVSNTPEPFLTQWATECDRMDHGLEKQMQIHAHDQVGIFKVKKKKSLNKLRSEITLAHESVMIWNSNWHRWKYIKKQQEEWHSVPVRESYISLQGRWWRPPLAHTPPAEER